MKAYVVVTRYSDGSLIMPTTVCLLKQDADMIAAKIGGEVKELYLIKDYKKEQCADNSWMGNRPTVEQASELKKMMDECSAHMRIETTLCELPNHIAKVKGESDGKP